MIDMGTATSHDEFSGVDGEGGAPVPGGKSYLIETITEHQAAINCMGLSDDGSILATGSDDFSVRLWTTKSQRCDCIGVLAGHEDFISCVVIEEVYVLSASGDATIRKWDMSTCECLLVMRGHGARINRIISTGDFIFSSSYDRTIRAWDFDNGNCVRVFTGHRSGVAPLIYIPADDEIVEEEERNQSSPDSEPTIRDILISGSSDCTARSWSFETGKTLQVFKDHKGAVTCLGTDPAGRTLFTGSTDGFVRSWNIKKGELVRQFSGHQSAIICLTVVGKVFYTGSSDHTARLWAMQYPESTRVFRGHEHTVNCIKHHDGLVFTSSGDGSAMCFDGREGAVKRIFKGPKIAINAIQIVGARLFTGAVDGALGIWDIRDLKVSQGPVTTAAKHDSKDRPIRRED